MIRKVSAIHFLVIYFLRHLVHRNTSYRTTSFYVAQQIRHSNTQRNNRTIDRYTRICSLSRTICLQPPYPPLLSPHAPRGPLTRATAHTKHCHITLKSHVGAWAFRILCALSSSSTATKIFAKSVCCRFCVCVRAQSFSQGSQGSQAHCAGYEIRKL